MKYNILNGTNVNTVNTDYSCELNNSKSESDEVHTLELPLVMFITLSTMWCNLNVFGMGWLNPNLSFFGGGWGFSCHTCRMLWLTCRRARVLWDGEASWSFLHKG